MFELDHEEPVRRRHVDLGRTILTLNSTVFTSDNDHQANIVGKNTDPVTSLRLKCKVARKVWERVVVQISSKGFIFRNLVL